jgi:hypothetical protein
MSGAHACLWSIRSIVFTDLEPFTAILSLSKDEQLRSTAFFDKLRMAVQYL